MKLTKIICAIFFLGTVLHDAHGMSRSANENIQPPRRRTIASAADAAIPAIPLAAELSAINRDDSANDTSTHSPNSFDIPRVTSFRPNRALNTYFGPALPLQALLEMPDPRNEFDALERMLTALILKIRYIKNSTQPDDEVTQMLILRTEMHIVIATSIRSQIQLQQSTQDAITNFFFTELNLINQLISVIHDGIHQRIHPNTQQNLTQCNEIIARMTLCIEEFLMV